MEAVRFKTNIKCAACVSRVTPYLNESAGVDHWSVDITHPEKILSVAGEPDEDQIREALKKAGYRAERI